jgi:hypothetical protein
VAEVTCPECHRPLAVPPDSKTGDVLPCPFCAGVSLRLSEGGGTWTASILKKVSCALCEAEIVLADDVQPGDVMEHCGRRQAVSFEYGAYALEPI